VWVKTWTFELTNTRSMSTMQVPMNSHGSSRRICPWRVTMQIDCQTNLGRQTTEPVPAVLAFPHTPGPNDVFTILQASRDNMGRPYEHVHAIARTGAMTANCQEKVS
jgi:hypothetical protein